MTDFFMEMGQATLQMLVHPLLYVFFVSSFLLGYRRVQKERKMFSIRIHDAIFETRHIWKGVILGLILSLLTLGLGVTVPLHLLYLITIVSLPMALLLQTRMLAPAYLLGFSLLLPLLFRLIPKESPFFTELVEGMNDVNVGSVAILVALLMMIEGLLIWKNASNITTPQLSASKRGKKVGAHVANRFWLIPVFLFIPTGPITTDFSWWPMFSVGNETYSLILFPFVFGFYQRTAGQLPREAVAIVGKQIFGLAWIVLSVAITGLWYPLIAIISLVLAAIGRIGISFYESQEDKQRPAYFSVRNHGLVILDIIPMSPAAKMGLKVGEIITKVNGESVQTEDAFYVAVQKNGAHCKLEVLDTNGELRLAQRALYRGEHHELGILFADEYVPMAIEPNQTVEWL